ncbi:MAG: stage II sporulation protein P [Clostridia bacterium]|jgi:stage II sporulation protein P|nr:stage II sporulation protein P [Clostridia bacterium]
MINVTVINLKTSIKYLVWVVILATGLACTSFFIKNSTKITFIQKISTISFNKCLDITLPDIEGKINRLEESKITSRSSNIKRVLGVELSMMDNIKNNDTITSNDINLIEEDILEETDIADTNIKTEEIKEHNITAKYNLTYGTVKVKNESKKEITEDILIPNISLENKKDILIFHTHTCESYTPSEKFNYEMTGSYRTTDLNFTVARVGRELKNYLNTYDFNVIHDETYHDYPAYSGSYGKSLTTVENLLKSQPNTQIILDLHRDAIGSNSDYAPSVKIGDEVAAQMMFVIGTDGGGLEHLNWQQNLKFAVKLQEKANELYPGLFRPIIVRNSRYNQHLSKAATIIEVGATGNTMEQCIVSMKYLSKILDEIMK